MLFGLPTSPECWRWLYGYSLVGQWVRFRSTGPLHPIVDWKEDVGGLGVFVVASVGDASTSRRPRDAEDGYAEVYQPYPTVLLNGRTSETVMVYHSITPSRQPLPVAPGRSVFRAEPGPP